MKLKKKEIKKKKLSIPTSGNKSLEKEKSLNITPGVENINDVMDYSFDFSIYYSGVENDAYFSGCYDMGIRHFLMSYHYLQKMKASLKSKYEGLGVKFFIDSGAHTYQNSMEFVNRTCDYWEKHLQRYLNWVKKNKEYIFAIANFDFENMVGGEMVKEWNEKYFEPFMLEENIPVCFVWHQNSFYDWDYYCKRYPYVGFSSVNVESGEDISFQEYVGRLKTAEKNNALVHGFGMTRTSMLPQLPFYTVDSTSWKSGFRYGQLAFWNTNKKKVQMVKKEDFGRAFKFIDNYGIDPPIDRNKIYKYDEPEVLRANIYAYQKAEEYIRSALRPLCYWKKAKVLKKNSLDDVKFPSLNWIKDNNNEGWEEYAKEFNVNPENSDWAIKIVKNISVLLQWDEFKDDPAIQDKYTEENIGYLHSFWINSIESTVEKKIEDLQKFYKDCILGENTTLLYYGTNFDRMTKERDEYITDEELDLVDVPEIEMQNLIGKYLPKKDDDDESMPEIEEIDKVLEENNIIPIRDERGRLIKGQKEVVKPKRLYSNKFPKLACSTCINAQKCPEYKEGYVCAYNKMFERYNTRDMDDIIQGMQGIADLAMIRLQRAMIAETMNGGIPDPMVSNLMNQTMGLYNNLQKMYMSGNQEVIKQTRTMRADGTQEITTQVSSNPSSGGILEKIFGSMNEEKSEKDNNIIDAQEVNKNEN